MKLLLDANISWRLVSKLKMHFADFFHVDHIELPTPVKDSVIWDYASKQGLMIVTNDEDFLNYSHVKGYPPKVILLRTGNQSSAFVENLLIKHKETIAAFDASKDLGLLEIREG